jgi:hypothetical protein
VVLPRAACPTVLVPGRSVPAQRAPVRAWWVAALNDAP